MHMLLVCVYDLIEFKNPRFSPSGSRKREADVFKKPPLWAPYLKNLHFRCPKTAFLFERKAETDKKSQFQEMSGYVWMEPKIRDIAGTKARVSSSSAKRKPQLLSGTENLFHPP